MNWNTVFEKEYMKEEGLSENDLQRFLSTWNMPMTEEEIAEIVERQRNPFPVTDPLHRQYTPFDPSRWTIPQMKLPDSYLQFLRYSNGGEFGNGDRYFQFFGAAEFREMNLAYELPEYMQGAVSFGMDGCGNHYVFDMRNDMRDGEYPILAAHSGNLGYEDSKKVADSFAELCIGTTSIDDELNEY
ncbi:SMI1/KNR4 family protein [Paenibacillus sp. GCM10027629]|uniref:SMI1/KNR4 family protein n=1 Tax=Paenibacillus sp. GCM10027629 TaxID=3273414 RepID=UPI00362AF7A6